MRTCYRQVMTPQPTLERIPQGALLGSDRVAPGWLQAVASFTDGYWHPVTIVAWCRYGRGWAALIRWPDGHEDWRRHDPRCLRRSVEHLGGFADK